MYLGFWQYLIDITGDDLYSLIIGLVILPVESTNGQNIHQQPVFIHDAPPSVTAHVFDHPARNWHFFLWRRSAGYEEGYSRIVGWLEYGAHLEMRSWMNKEHWMPYVMQSGICQIGGTYFTHPFCALVRWMTDFARYKHAWSSCTLDFKCQDCADLAPISEVCSPLSSRICSLTYFVLITLLPWNLTSGPKQTEGSLLPWPRPLCSNRARVYVLAIWV